MYTKIDLMGKRTFKLDISEELKKKRLLSSSKPFGAVLLFLFSLFYSSSDMNDESSLAYRLMLR